MCLVLLAAGRPRRQRLSAAGLSAAARADARALAEEHENRTQRMTDGQLEDFL